MIIQTQKRIWATKTATRITENPPSIEFLWWTTLVVFIYTDSSEALKEWAQLDWPFYYQHLNMGAFDYSDNLRASVGINIIRHATNAIDIIFRFLVLIIFYF